jgi:hypothetical protein
VAKRNERATGKNWETKQRRIAEEAQPRRVRTRDVSDSSKSVNRVLLRSFCLDAQAGPSRNFQNVGGYEALQVAELGADIFPQRAALGSVQNLTVIKKIDGARYSRFPSLDDHSKRHYREHQMRRLGLARRRRPVRADKVFCEAVS